MKEKVSQLMFVSIKYLLQILPHYVGVPTPDQPQVILVFFLGGCTFAEISALRYLAGRDEGTCIMTMFLLINDVLMLGLFDFKLISFINS